MSKKIDSSLRSESLFQLKIRLHYDIIKYKNIYLINGDRAMHFVHRNKMTCSRKVEFDLDEENRIKNVVFEGGCDGNLKGITALAEGMKAEDYIAACRGIKCGFKPTSCPDQLAQALEEAIKKHE
jgi:uncharacterized protein (TIGR03905 family)